MMGGFTSFTVDVTETKLLLDSLEGLGEVGVFCGCEGVVGACVSRPSPAWDGYAGGAIVVVLRAVCRSSIATTTSIQAWIELMLSSCRNNAPTNE